MITEIPTSDEFESAAYAQFDFAWDIVISFMTTLDEAGQYIDVDKDDQAQFWEAARQRILTSLIIAQQGVELAIKGKLVGFSPYLLLGSPSDWPKVKTGKGIEFSEFKTIDASELVNAYNMVSPLPFDTKFVELFGRVRKLRNSAMHSVNAKLRISPKDVILIILEAHEHLYPDQSWVMARKEFLLSAPAAQIYFDNDHIDGVLVREYWAVFNLLSKSERERFFNVAAGVRKYICPTCRYHSLEIDGPVPHYAVLKPNKPRSTTLWCFVCDDTHLVKRARCSDATCKGNVISDEHGCCCTCGEEQ
ncbi:hypothetical protein [Pseudomonas syringae]|uniref:Uncharacterized protein n=1 Tax=Pseudomonas syringae TaxID=317 RepID=A0AB38C1U6_PSESX|nr:hypothetical protein [Pseudomonas syringae]MCK0551330.1 hypothetical protein [Pseudomonas syringae pv. aptata]SFO57938.1 hypothetical protein SAMN05444065_1388 [Pseudomonas syringae]SFP06887.1 hypothetical protein SAMN05444063_1516 [Pseudomonas syringae]